MKKQKKQKMTVGAPRACLQVKSSLPGLPKKMTNSGGRQTTHEEKAEQQEPPTRNEQEEAEILIVLVAQRMVEKERVAFPSHDKLKQKEE